MYSLLAPEQLAIRIARLPILYPVNILAFFVNVGVQVLRPDEKLLLGRSCSRHHKVTGQAVLGLVSPRHNILVTSHRSHLCKNRLNMPVRNIKAFPTHCECYFLTFQVCDFIISPVSSIGKSRYHVLSFIRGYIIPQNQSAQIDTRLSAFGKNLLSNVPPIPGLDDSIVIKPERLHLTLGVMSLRPPGMKSPTQESTSENANYTVESALTLLHSLREQIYDLLKTAKSPLSIRFSRLDIMQPPRGTTKKGDAHVLWTGPVEMSEGDEENKILNNVCSGCN